jgi:hypothetical protein
MIDHFVSTCVKSFDLPSVDDLIVRFLRRPIARCANPVLLRRQ